MLKRALDQEPHENVTSVSGDSQEQEVSIERNWINQYVIHVILKYFIRKWIQNSGMCTEGSKKSCGCTSTEHACRIVCTQRYPFIDVSVVNATDFRFPCTFKYYHNYCVKNDMARLCSVTVACRGGTASAYVTAMQ